jgi:negative regulator of replication initiation
MLDPVAVERAEKSIDEFISSRSKARDKVNADADLLSASEHQRRERIRERNRVLWIDHYATLAESFALRSSEYQRRARALEQGLTKGVSDA